MRLKFVVLVLSLIVISGCVQREVRTDENNGLVINAFEADLYRVEEGEQFTLFLEVENVGGTTAENVKSNLYGASWASPGEKTVSKLSPPDIVSSPPIPGDFYQVEWMLDAPDLEEGVEQDFRLVTRINYDYNSNPVSNIPALSKEEYRRKTMKGEVVDEGISTSNTPGPIKVYVTGSSPIIVRSDLVEGEDNQYVMRIAFTNVGYGIPITDNVDGKIKGHVKIMGIGATMENCLGVDVNGNEADFDVVLRSGQDVTKGCTINIDKDEWGMLPKETVTLEFSLSYQYYIDKDITITAIGRIGKRSSSASGNGASTTSTIGGADTAPFFRDYCKQACEYNNYDGNSARCRMKVVSGGGVYVELGHVSADADCKQAATDLKKKSGDWKCFCETKTVEYTAPFTLQKCTDACVYNKYSAASAQCKKHLTQGGGVCNHIGHATADNECTAKAKEKGGTGDWWCCCDGVTTTTLNWV
ncbi:MAG: hypothetical protein HZB66_02605 [Candidatus Aenigmarchaeota archaeon]|nr:hypothetical protein [Candidatus Aenigmarchaeota archaeon]